VNCQRNYPWYRDWAKTFDDENVTIIGVHTPESTGEQDLAAVRAKVQEAEFHFPVVIDNDKANWDAWGNSMWPSVYLIDKRGYLRYWWYGELNWQEAGGQKLMKQRIDELLDEP